MTNTPTARAASSTPAISDSRGRNSWLAALAVTISSTVDSATPTVRTARRYDQQYGRQRDADSAYDRAEQHDAAEHDDERPPFEPRHRRTRTSRRAERQDAAEDDEQDAEDAREVARTHPRRRAERVFRAQHDRRDAECYEQHARPEVPGVADRHHPTLRSMTTLKLAIARTGCQARRTG